MLADTDTVVPLLYVAAGGTAPERFPFPSYDRVKLIEESEDGGGVTGVEGLDGGALDLGSAIVRRVVMFVTRHEPVIGQRNTPDVPSAQSVRRPGVISTVFAPHPLAGLTVTTRDVARGLRDVASQQSRGAGLELDHVTAVPPHVRPGSTRDTIPDESRQTVTGADAGAAMAVEVATAATALVAARTNEARVRAPRADHQRLMRPSRSSIPDPRPSAQSS